MNTQRPSNVPSLSIRSPRQAADYLGLSVSTLAKMRVYGRGPPFVKLGRRVGYTDPDLDEWLAANRFQSTSEYK
ncbi:helix-turn-helix domain-containing protein [Hoeflea sp. CAU 1731]